MTTARSTQIDLSATPYYHCINRCVRRAFLCGEDFHSGKSYEHRRGWIAEKMKQLSLVFAIDVAAYAVMSNHYHVVLRVDQQMAMDWDAEAIIDRWGGLFKLPLLVENFRKGLCSSEAERVAALEIVEEWRGRLYDISWFMRILNEFIARESNREDGVKGRFWEGRFKCQPLLDEAAVISCMAYVDLNPIRAGMAETPEQSAFTSIQERIQETINPSDAETPSPLLPFADQGGDEKAKEKSIPIEYHAYLDLVDWSGRAILNHKRGAIPENIPPILSRLAIDPNDWIRHMRYFERLFPTAAGCIDTLRALAERTARQWVRGVGNAGKPLLTGSLQQL